MQAWQRSEALLSKEALTLLKQAHVFLFGIGGVGSFVAEALVRSGIGTLSLVDDDVVELSNLNRQLMSSQSTLGQLKLDVMAQRLLSINPDLKLHVMPERVTARSIYDFKDVQVVVEAMDDVVAKVRIMELAQAQRAKMLMALGSARRLDPTQVTRGDLYTMQGDPLAKKIRGLARKQGLDSVEVVYSKERPRATLRAANHDKVILGSMIFVPGAVGLALAHRVVQICLQDKV